MKNQFFFRDPTSNINGVLIRRKKIKFRFCKFLSIHEILDLNFKTVFKLRNNCEPGLSGLLNIRSAGNEVRLCQSWLCAVDVQDLLSSTWRRCYTNTTFSDLICFIVLGVGLHVFRYFCKEEQLWSCLCYFSESRLTWDLLLREQPLSFNALKLAMTKSEFHPLNIHSFIST